MDNWKHKKAREKINVETLKNKQNQIFHILEKNYGKVELIMKMKEIVYLKGVKHLRKNLSFRFLI